MSKQSLERECSRENKKNRNVDLVQNQRMDDFWRRTRGNFFISGDENINVSYRYGAKEDGMAHLRRQMLLSAVRNCPDFSRGTLVIIHNDDILENEMIGMSGTLGRQLVVVSEQYRNYHLFYKMSIERIQTFFEEVGRMEGYHNMADLGVYISAFMEIVECAYPVSLQSMMVLAKKSDQEISNIAKAYGVDYQKIQDFGRVVSTGVGDTFRKNLKRVCSALSGITSDDCDTRFNMITACKKNEPSRVILIKMNSNDTKIFNLYMKYELEQIQQCQISVIIDNIPMCNEDGLIYAVKSIAINQYGAAGLCAGDIFNMVDEHDLRGFSTHCIFKHANGNSLDTLLENYSTYRFAYVQETEVLPANRLFAIMPQKSFTKAYDERHPKIMAKEVSLAVLKGHNADRPAIVDRLS